MLYVKQVSVGYSNNTSIFTDLNFQLHKGQILGIFGMNGAGKSTLLNTLFGEIPYHGFIELDGECLSKSLAHKRNEMCFVQDTPFLYPFLRSIEYLEFFANLKELEFEPLREKIRFMAKGFGMDEKLLEICNRLSLGQKKKLYLMANFLSNPKYILLDEPTNSLDLQSIFFLEKIIHESARSGAIVIYSSHNFSFLENQTQYGLFLAKDRAPVWIEEFSSGRLRDQFQNTYV